MYSSNWNTRQFYSHNEQWYTQLLPRRFQGPVYNYECVELMQALREILLPSENWVRGTSQLPPDRYWETLRSHGYTLDLGSDQRYKLYNPGFQSEWKAAFRHLGKENVFRLLWARGHHRPLGLVLLKSRQEQLVSMVLSHMVTAHPANRVQSLLADEEYCKPDNIQHMYYTHFLNNGSIIDGRRAYYNFDVFAETLKYLCLIPKRQAALVIKQWIPIIMANDSPADPYQTSKPEPFVVNSMQLKILFMLLGSELLDALLCEDYLLLRTSTQNPDGAVNQLVASFFPEGECTTEEVVHERVNAYLSNTRRQQSTEETIQETRLELAQLAAEMWGETVESFMEKVTLLTEEGPTETTTSADSASENGKQPSLHDQGVAYTQLYSDSDINVYANFDDEGELGRGGFGVVVEGRITYANDPAPQRVAIKCMREINLSRPATRTFKQEARVMSELRSPYIVNMKCYFVSKASPYIVVEYMDKGSLSDCIYSDEIGGINNLALRIRMAWEIASGLAYLHQTTISLNGREKHIIHQDIKGQNVLVGGSDYHAKIADFGLVKLKASSASTTVLAPGRSAPGTQKYKAPEVLLGGAHTQSSDMYSFGLVICELMNMDLIFTGVSDDMLLAHARSGTHPPINEDVPEAINQLILQCWLAVSQRITAQQAADALQVMMATAPTGEAVSTAPDTSHSSSGTAILQYPPVRPASSTAYRESSAASDQSSHPDDAKKPAGQTRSPTNTSPWPHAANERDTSQPSRKSTANNQPMDGCSLFDAGNSSSAAATCFRQPHNLSAEELTSMFEKASPK